VWSPQKLLFLVTIELLQIGTGLIIVSLTISTGILYPFQNSLRWEPTKSRLLLQELTLINSTRNGNSKPLTYDGIRTLKLGSREGNYVEPTP
jgi:hypothetical protein